MTPALRTIYDTLEALGARPPKVHEYTNALLVAFRNGDGHRVALLIPHDTSPADIKDKLTLAYKTKATVSAMTTQELLTKID